MPARSMSPKRIFSFDLKDIGHIISGRHRRINKRKLENNFLLCKIPPPSEECSPKACVDLLWKIKLHSWGKPCAYGCEKVDTRVLDITIYTTMWFSHD